MLNIFDIRTGKVKKSFKGSAKDFGISRDKGIPSIAWPLIRFFSGFTLLQVIKDIDVSLTDY